ncbi:MAG: putative ankyrin repeat protein L25 [Satyrvirus sp.]|uniref:Putative ankyrin repeat protein L25 n=1 Tax=Satyrvirus sp. TaxID=2487771 RepID=A0A3G5AIZ2_9VIRU|nr:MAG: putative ankyrin repeat protein L25 [Satyrvirus sp.]
MENLKQVVANELLKMERDVVIQILDVIMSNHKNITTDEIKFMMDHVSNEDRDVIFNAAHKFTNPDIVLFMIKEYNIDINKHFLAYELDCELDIFVILLEEGLVLTDEMLKYFMRQQNYMKFFVENYHKYNIDFENLLDIICDSTKSYPMYASYRILLFDTIFKMDTPKFSKKSFENITSLFLRYPFYDKLTFEKLNFLVDIGLDPRENGDYLLCWICRVYNDPKMVDFLVSSCGCNMNMRDSDCLVHSIDNDNHDVSKLLISLGIKITGAVISSCTRKKNYLDLLSDYGLDYEQMLNLYLEYLKKNDFVVRVSTLKIFIDKGVDIISAINKYH